MIRGKSNRVLQAIEDRSNASRGEARRMERSRKTASYPWTCINAGENGSNVLILSRSPDALLDDGD